LDINLRLSKGYKFGFVDQNYSVILSTSLIKITRVMQQSYLQVTNKYLEEIKSIQEPINHIKAIYLVLK
jgi:hypothetical protein